MKKTFTLILFLGLFAFSDSNAAEPLGSNIGKKWLYLGDKDKISSGIQEQEIVVFPNLVDDQITVQTSKKLRLTVYSITGKIVKEVEVKYNLQQVDLGSLLPGNYVVMLQDVDEQCQVQRIVKK